MRPIAMRASSTETALVAAVDIPVGMTSKPSYDGCASLKRLLVRRPVQLIIKVTIEDGSLTAAQGTSCGPLSRAVRLARDCHEQNAQMIRNADGQFAFLTTRPIAAGDEIKAWFGIDLLAELGVPVLTPAHIQGHQSYVCLQCGLSFQQPNPLKVHMLLDDCRSSPVDTRLLLAQQATFSLREGFGTVSPPPAHSQVRIPIPRPALAARLVAARSAEESNEGTAPERRGHRCIFCGKLYSRRYGLKIHVRTHTGYKPLQCRFCLRPFSDPSNLNKHVRLHAELDSPYRCRHCGKVLVRRRDLDRHLRSRHHGARVTEERPAEPAERRTS